MCSKKIRRILWVSSVNTNVNSFGATETCAMQAQSIGSSLEKLSTGYKINSASDDAAGLSISESLQAQDGGMSEAAQVMLKLVLTCCKPLKETLELFRITFKESEIFLFRLLTVHMVLLKETLFNLKFSKS